MGKSRAEEVKRRMSSDGRGLGGFYEATLSLMVVTLGVVLLTASFAFLSAKDMSSDDGLASEARELMDDLLSDASLFSGDRAAERSDLVRMSLNGLPGDSPPGVRVMITELGGGSEVLYQNGDPENIRERASLSEPVNVRYSPEDVRPASLTVWVWR